MVKSDLAVDILPPRLHRVKYVSQICFHDVFLVLRSTLVCFEIRILCDSALLPCDPTEPLHSAVTLLKIRLAIFGSKLTSQQLPKHIVKIEHGGVSLLILLQRLLQNLLVLPEDRQDCLFPQPDRGKTRVYLGTEFYSSSLLLKHYHSKEPWRTI